MGVRWEVGGGAGGRKQKQKTEGPGGPWRLGSHRGLPGSCGCCDVGYGPGRCVLELSMLRAAVKTIDPVKPARAFGDKEEWKIVLMALQTAGKLTYLLESDTVALS